LGHEVTRVLVVDDDQGVRVSLKRLFRCQNWEVVTANCGSEALGIISSTDRFHAIVADFFMPNMNGLDFLRQVNMRSPETYCIMLTAYPCSHAIVYAMGKYLKADLVEKPWTDNLIKMIESALQTQRSNDNGQVS